jgi:hypothetical protein
LRSANGPAPHPQSQPARARVTLQRVIFASAIVLAGGCFCGQGSFAQNPDPENQSNVVRGTVVNAVTHEPIGRSLVHSPDNRYAMFTDGEGHFEFTLPKPVDENGGVGFSGGVIRHFTSVITLMARKPGFPEEQNGGKVVEAAPGTEIMIPLIPEALIKGRVSLPAADPVRGINVQLYFRQVQDGSLRWMLKSSARTNSNGDFRFAELDPGTYKVFTGELLDNDPETTIPGGQLYGFPPVYYPAASKFAGASPIQLTAGQIVQADMSLVRQPYYPVRIPVVNPEQNGGLNITVSLQGQRGPGYSLGYNWAKGAIEGSLPNGKYLVEASGFGQNSMNGSVNLTVAGAPAEGPSMVLARNNLISVNVKEEFTSQQSSPLGSWSDGKHTYILDGPRFNLQISALATDEFEQRSGSVRDPTRNDDPLVLENLAPGRYWLRLRANRGYVASATMGGTDLLREPLVVVPGANTPIDITLRDDTAELEGTLLGVPSTQPTPGRWAPPGFIYCIPLPDSAGQFLEISASRDGKFDYQTVTPGVYHVVAFSSQQRDLPYRDAEAMKVYEAKGQVVHFAPGQKVTLQLQITQGSE